MYHICLSIHLLMHVGLFLHLGLMRITLLKTLIQISESLLSVLLGKCPKVALGHKVVSFSEKTPYGFPQHLHHFIFPPTMHKGSSFSTSSPHLRFSLFYSIITVISVSDTSLWLRFAFSWWLVMSWALYGFVYDVSLCICLSFFFFRALSTMILL